MTLMYTAINIPYCSLGAALTSDPRESLSLQSWRFAITQSAARSVRVYFTAG
jgi:GPH family glycoside/pentoside/hexuronide:cation symporter